MCSCAAEFVITLRQPWLCNSYIKEKLTLIIQQITGTHKHRDRQRERLTEGQTDGHIDKHQSRDQVVPRSSSVSLCVRVGRVAFIPLEISMFFHFFCPIFQLIFFLSLLHLLNSLSLVLYPYVFSIYSVDSLISCLLSDTHNTEYKLLLSGISEEGPTQCDALICCSSKSHFTDSPNSSHGDCNSTPMLTCLRIMS